MRIEYRQDDKIMAIVKLPNGKYINEYEYFTKEDGTKVCVMSSEHETFVNADYYMRKHRPGARMVDSFEQLVFDYDQFEYNFDTYGYDDAIDNRENGMVLAKNALIDPEFREQIIERLEGIAEECEDYAEDALALADRIKKLKLTTVQK